MIPKAESLEVRAVCDQELVQRYFEMIGRQLAERALRKEFGPNVGRGHRSRDCRQTAAAHGPFTSLPDVETSWREVDQFIEDQYHG